MLEGNSAPEAGLAGKRLSRTVESDGADVLPWRGKAARRGAGAPSTVRPKRTCPVIGIFMEAWREGLPEDERSILVPLLAQVSRSRATLDIAERRAFMAADWLVRIYTPVWLNLAGLREQARLLYALPEITELAQAFEIRPILAQVSRRANAEALHVDEAGWIRASDDCWASAWAGAFEAARLGADDPAWLSAAAASRAAAGLASGGRTHPFKAALQGSAAELVLKMARLGDRPAVRS